MKKIVCIVNALLILSLANAQTLTTPQPSPLQTIKQNFALGSIELSYSRPAKKGRKIMGDLVPFGKVWRTGANAATTITFSEEVTIGGLAVKAGKYGLLTIPDAGKWTVIISKDVNVSSPAAYKPENDVVRVQSDVVTTPFTVENFTINFANITTSSCNVEMMWENSYISFPITAGTDAKVMKQIDNIMNKDNKPYYNAASYYYDNGKDLNQALVWVNKAVETNKEAYWMFLLKARIHQKLGDKAASRAAATTCKDLAAKDKNEDYIKMANELIASL
ncbi:MAG: DUF2911 domain-containing protein [Chitinophagaceae bacterium]|nr:DUF2911 domain-containing protein [Chitinophagaceae bacterium]MBK7558416.1 DUF2911 domain-containing protein [Chitinophagaceae bacterium]